jgi:hypothetical protein
MSPPRRGHAYTLTPGAKKRIAYSHPVLEGFPEAAGLGAIFTVRRR